MLIRKEFAEDGVLIELYWNVNFLIHKNNAIAREVLIELYWNVNKYDPVQLQEIAEGINRTILECKCNKLRE